MEQKLLKICPQGWVQVARERFDSAWRSQVRVVSIPLLLALGATAYQLPSVQAHLPCRYRDQPLRTPFFLQKKKTAENLRKLQKYQTPETNPSSVSHIRITTCFLLKCYAESFEALKDGMVIHCDVLKMGLGYNVFVQNILLDFYVTCEGNLGFALRVFEEMPQKDVVSWNSMIGAYMARGDIESAIELFELMPERNIVTWNSVLSGL
ncbi:hypothetical protein REPUB_Repub19eG0115700 [Reevesia pubescens]